MRITAGPYLQNVTRDSITVMWHTDEASTSAVEFEASEKLGWSAYEEKKSLSFPERVSDDRLVRVHALTITGLLEEWVYFYRVASEDGDGCAVRSVPASFRTAVRPGSPFRFVSYGDDMGLSTAHRRNAELARQYRPMLCVGTGDAAQDVVERFQGDFFDCTRELLKYTPWFATMGNHDSPNDGYFRFFSYPQPRYWYSFNYGCAHFIVLNSNFDYTEDSEQWRWLESDLARFRDAQWKFVFFHHPPYCSNCCEIESTRVLCRLFEEHRVDIVYNAHATLYERFHPIRDGVYDAQNGVIYIVAGGGGYNMAMATSLPWDHVHPMSATLSSVNHFVLTSVAPHECLVRAIDNSNHVIDRFLLTKEVKGNLSLPDACPVPAYPDVVPEGTVVAGLEEGVVRWVLPSPAFSVDVQEARSGGNCIRWDLPGGETVFPAVRKVLKHNGKALGELGGRRYEVSLWIKTTNVTGGVGAAFEWNGDMGFLGRVSSRHVAGSTGYQRVIFTVPELPAHVYSCRIVLTAKPGSSGVAWFDDICISEIPEGET